MLHSLEHTGVSATLILVTNRFFLPNKRRDITSWTRSCIQCQKSKVHRHIRAPSEKFEELDSRFRHIHIDILGPWPVSNGYTYLLTCIDRFSRCPEAVPLDNILAESVAQSLVSTWISIFGMHERITTDRGGQFESHLFLEMSRLLGAKHIHTTSYHSISNGIIEWFHRQLQTAIRAFQEPTKWTDKFSK